MADELNQRLKYWTAVEESVLSLRLKLVPSHRWLLPCLMTQEGSGYQISLCHA